MSMSVPRLASLSNVRVATAFGLLVAQQVSRVPPFNVVRKLFTDTIPLKSIPTDKSPQDPQVIADSYKYAPKNILHHTLVAVSALEVALWCFGFGLQLHRCIEHDIPVKDLLSAAGVAAVWTVLLFRNFLRPPIVPPWTNIVVYLWFAILSLVVLAGAAYQKYATGAMPVWATDRTLLFESLNAALCITLAIVASFLRFNRPQVLALAPDVAPDDVVTLSQWLTFTWMNPLIKKGAARQLEPEDVPRLSPTQQTKIVFDCFRSVIASSLVWRILKANRFDLLVDVSLTFVACCLQYLLPFFLQKIVSGIMEGTPESIGRAYVFGTLGFLAQITKAVVDLVHLWHGRRANIRVKAGLTASIYEKALKRKDTAGVVQIKEADGKTEEVDTKQNAADTGKVVNMMSGDAQRIANMVSFLYQVSSNPFEIAIASYYLYQLLGWSAFVGVAVLVISWPLNSFLSNRAVKIQKTWLKARDKRISIMTELIGAITFIKFFAWTGKWKERAMEARNAELKQMVRGIFNSLAFYFLWGLVPLCIKLLAFFSFIFFQHGKLTVDVAFTALALFQMLRMPLNILPTFIVMMLQAKVALNRISDFLDEEEVPDWVSSLKRPADQTTGSEKVAFERATLRWNAGEQTSDSNSAANGTTAGGRAENGDDITVSAPPSEAEVFELTDINIDFPVGKLSVVTGPTGAGKSALLVGLLGEMDVLSGEVFLPKNLMQVDPATGLRNSCAYGAQTPWLQQMSIKDNILFGEELDDERYEAVVDACALRTDFDILEDGDDTEIGAKGVSLSGGQKARVALARAIYSYTKHLLLDDPLAAVDSQTAKHLVEQCFNGPLLKDRTVILVSHHLDLLLSSADYIVRVLDGRIACQGTPSELKNELAGIVAVEAAVTRKEAPVSADDATVLEMQEEATKDMAMQKKKEKKKGPARKLVKDEERAVGNVKLSTYARYFRAATWITWIFFFLALLLQQGSSLLERWWLKIWGEAYNTKVHSWFQFAGAHDQNQHIYSELRHNWIYHDSVDPALNATPELAVQSIGDFDRKLPSADSDPLFYLGVYACISILTILASVAGSAASRWGSYRAARKLHNELLDSVLRSTIRFFNTTPMGRILNRCTKDIETVDGSLAGSLSTVMVFTGSLIAATGMVVYVVPGFALPAVGIMAMYYSYAVLYLRTGRGLRRLEATSKSPIFSGFAELLDGIISVRAFSAEHRFFEGMCKQVDTANAAFYYYWMTNRWLLLRFDVLGAMSVYATTILCLSGAVSPGSAGVAITSAQGFVQACYWVSRFVGELEMDFNSVERIEEYLLLPPEPPATIPGHQPPAYWPSYNGNEDFIRAENVEIKYAPELPTVFKGSFSIKPGEKIGLIGRTGSGKSTVAMSLLRFTDPASGKIVLDGIDITSIGVDDLRSRITYIPQDAVLFSGTIRDNLDPFGEHVDAELIEALTRVKLINPDTAAATRAGTPAVSRTASLVAVDQRLAQVAAEDAAMTRTGSSSSLASGMGTPRVHITLNSEVSAGGANFSQGQRQLVAMARALLRRSNLIIMDEATSSVDFETDSVLQAAIRSEFKSSTVLSIAHRLSSVIDYDRLLVLADGGVAEFDTPMNLLRRGGLFKTLCQKSGKYDELYRAAERKEQADGYESEGTLIDP